MKLTLSQRIWLRVEVDGRWLNKSLDELTDMGPKYAKIALQFALDRLPPGSYVALKEDIDIPPEEEERLTQEKRQEEADQAIQDEKENYYNNQK